MATENPEPDSPQKDSPQSQPVAALTEALKAELHQQQDPVYAVVGGLAAALVGAVIWAAVTVATKYQIGYMALGVGLLAGFSVRYFGAGIDKYFGFIGAFFALLGCALGNLLSQIGFAAINESLGYFEMLGFLNFDVIMSIYVESFSPLDVVFYGLAAYEGYKFAFRKIEVELAEAVATGRVVPPPYAKYRFPLVIALFVGLTIVGYVVSRGSVGVKTYYYDSGSKRALGEIIRGRENGYWETWWENGKIQSQGYYIDGQQDSAWSYYNEEGVITQTGNYQSGLQEGEWKEFADGGVVVSNGSYHHGRQQGPWSFFYEDGTVLSKGAFTLDQYDGPWESYSETGKLSSKGSYDMGTAIGPWSYWKEDGSKSQELDYGDGSVIRYLNTWTAKGAPEIVNGNGTLSYLYAEGKVQESGSVRNGFRVGRWKKFYEDGSRQEEGDFKDNVYYMINAWTPEGKALVTNGNGTYEDYHEDGALATSGKFENGLKTGQWVGYFPGERKVQNEVNFVAGKLTGESKNYFEDGTVNVEGSFANDKRDGRWTWYAADGQVESLVTFADGKKEGTQFFYDAGKLIRTEVYSKGELVESKVGGE